MTEKGFLRRLHSKENTDNENAHAILKELLKENWHSEAEELWNEFVKKIKMSNLKVKMPEQIIQDNFQVIISSFDFYYFINNVLPELITIEKLQDFMEECFGPLAESVKFFAERKGSSFNVNDYRFSDIVKLYIDSVKNSEEFIKKYAIFIIETAPLNDVLRVVQYIKGKNDQIDEMLNDNIDSNKMRLVHYIIQKAFHNKKSRYDITENEIAQIEDEYAQTVLVMLEELMQSEGKRWTDLREIGGASFSQVFEIGEKIFKLGIPRKTYQIPYSRRILKPLIRTNLYHDNETVGCIEIAERVDMSFDIEDTEILYHVWKELREDGIMWSDPHPGNIGKLLKDNVPVFYGEEMNIEDSAIGFYDETPENEEVLKKGEYVIVDTDLLYKITDDNLENILMTELAELFEKHYQEEKRTEEMHKQKNYSLKFGMGER